MQEKVLKKKEAEVPGRDSIEYYELPDSEKVITLTAKEEGSSEIDTDTIFVFDNVKELVDWAKGLPEV